MVRKIDLAFVEASNQILGRKVDQLDVAGEIDHRIGHGLADSNFGYSGNDVVQAFDMLDIEGRIDIDPGDEQLLDIHVAFGMPALRRIGMRKLVDQDEARPSRQNSVKVHFGERVALVIDDPARDNFEPLQKRLGLLTAMRLGDADDDIGAFGLFCPRCRQHFIGLADARRGAEKDLQAAMFGLLCFTQESVGRRPPLGVVAFVHATRYSCSTAHGVSFSWQACRAQG